MGATLALQAVGFANLAKLNPTARCVLNYMALRALDDASATPQTPSRRSFMRRSELGLAIGRFMPDSEPGPDAPIEERRQWNADDQAIWRALYCLKAAGAIKERRKARTGWTVEYEIILDDRVSQNVALEGAQNVALDPVPATKNVAPGFTERSPNEYPRNNTLGNRPRTTSPKRAPHFQPVDNSDALEWAVPA
jgi:hypothetical protein